ncbi:MAG: anaerobic ribonucleoside-triphosphate reductase activating protein [bacterium]|nr:anaerobic ribonucleoside-triphosphate reductase activating protein [bacterium]
MKIGGLQKLTLVDYPGKVAATVFLIGCNFRCGFCHNPELVNPEEAKKQPLIDEKEFFEFLEGKEGLIDGICITGGEPTIQPDLYDFIRKIRQKGFLIKLDTNGSNPEVLSKLVNENLVDFIAMDIKTSLDNYKKTVGTEVNLENIKKSVEIIKSSGIDYEFRTTVVPGLVEKKDIEEIGKWLKGAKKIVLQQFQNKKVLNNKFKKIQQYPDKTLKEFGKILEKHIGEIELRL